MNKVYFMNNGNFDPMAMLTFGVSVKDNDNTIGYFGTGFKYAVSIILRLGGKISIESGSSKYVFTTREIELRGDVFNLVLCNGKDAGFTTRLGINWVPWMAFRELYCNASDEMGETSHSRKDYDTVVTVDCAEIKDAYLRKSDYFIKSKPIISANGVDIHAGPSEFVYCCGVAVSNITKSKYTYNITTRISLTEDRTAKYAFEYMDKIKDAVRHCMNIKYLYEILQPGDSFESRLSFDGYVFASDEFVEAATARMKTSAGTSDGARKLLKDIKDKRGDWPTFNLSFVQQSSLDKAVLFLKGIGVSVDDFPVHVVSGLGPNVMGRALNGKIYLSDIAFQLGTKQIASTLLEEWVHNKYGCEDFDRNMQSWLFDKVLSIGEEINGEPL